MVLVSTRDPFAIAALAGAGSLVGHEIGYLADPAAASGHDYLAVLAPFAIAGAVLAIWVSALSVLRRIPGRAPNVAALATTQSALYLTFEVGERLVGSTDSPLLSLPVALGLLAQPVVAWLAIRALRLGVAAIGAVVDPLIAPIVARSTWQQTPHHLAPVLVLGRVPARAPPLVF